MNRNITSYLCLVILLLISACGGGKSTSESQPFKTPPTKKLTYEEAVKDWRNNKGVGPVKSLELGDIDEAMVEEGTALFKLKCSACHDAYKEKVGPALLGITHRRTPEWIMNMILNPTEMAKTDPICVGLLAQYNLIMADQSITEPQARQLLEYFRTIDIESKE